MGEILWSISKGIIWTGFFMELGQEPSGVFSLWGFSFQCVWEGGKFIVRNLPSESNLKQTEAYLKIQGGDIHVM